MKVSAFQVAADEGDDEVFIFAESEIEALEIYVKWHKDAYGKSALNPVVSTYPRSRFIGEMRSLQTEMDQGIKGLAGWTVEAGWHIYPWDSQFAGE